LPLFNPERCTVIDLLHAVLRTENGAHQADKLPLKFRLCIACYRGSDNTIFNGCYLHYYYVNMHMYLTQEWAFNKTAIYSILNDKTDLKLESDCSHLLDDDQLVHSSLI
jgi:hypothetical protein